MWPYKNHSEKEYYRVIEYVQSYAETLGAEYVCSKLQKFSTYWRDKAIQETIELV